MWMRNFWNNHIHNIWNGLLVEKLNGNIFWMFHLKTNNVPISQTVIRHSVSIQSMHFVFPFCPLEAGYIVIPLSKQTWESEATLLSDFSSFLPLRVWSYTKTLWYFFNIKFTLKNLISRSRSSLLDRGLAEFIFPNATFTQNDDQTYFCSKLNITYNSSLGSLDHCEADKSDTYNPRRKMPSLVIDKAGDAAVLLTTDKDEYTFLSCGDPSRDPPNFLALFMPFSNITWVLIFMTIFGWPLVLSVIENGFNLKKVLSDFDALFIGWAMILEQSHFRATNYKGRGPLYFYCGCVLLAILVLSNAYKGDNIQSLTKSFEIVPLTHMDQVVKAGYKKFTPRICSNWKYPKFCHESFSFEAIKRKSQYTDTQQKLWKPTHHEYLYNTSTFDPLKVDIFGKCRKKALLGWRRELVKLEKELRVKHQSAYIYLGQEFIFTRIHGWILTRYGSVKVLKRIWTVVESGVHNKLINVSFKAPVAKGASEPRRLTIHGNISVQFVYHSFGLLLALMVFIAELHKCIILHMNSFCLVVRFLIRNFFRQSQITFKLGLNYLYTKRSKIRLHFAPV